MIIFKIDELVIEKEKKDGGRISLQNIANETGINRTVLSKMKNQRETYSTTTNTINLLCEYFDCTVGDVIEFKRDKE